MPDEPVQPPVDQIQAVPAPPAPLSLDSIAQSAPYFPEAQPRFDMDNRQKFIISSPKMDRSKPALFNRPMPKLASELDSRSNKLTGYKPMPERIQSMQEKGWLSNKDGWTSAADKRSSVLKSSSRKALQGKVEDETDILNSYWGWRGIMEPEYDLLEGYTILDTESLYKQAIVRMHSLAFRNGVHVVGEDELYINYLKERIGQVGFVMRKGFTQWLKEVIKNLWICSNCIVSKIRDNDNSGGVKNEKNGNLAPVAGYYIIPPHTIFPFLDGRGHIEKWRRFYKDGRPFRDYAPEDIIHFKWDVKPGHIYGTPRVVSVRDDIFALRRLEENVELLLINHLFPLFHVKVGTEKEPVEYLPDGSSEIDYVRGQITNMPKEGVFVTDDRVEVKVEGVKGKGSDPGPMIAHYLTRVMVGLGVSGVDLGVADTANRATADNVSQNLKEMVKSDLQSFSDMVDMHIFLEMFLESPVKLSVQKAVATTHLDFGEIDVDGQIKQETHALNAFGSHAIDQDELRKRFRANPVSNAQSKKMHFQLHMVGFEKEKHKLELETLETQHSHEAKLQAQTEKHQDKLAAKSEDGKLKAVAVTAASTKKTKVTKKTSTGASHTKEVHEPTSHAKKALSNIVQPANQHGKNLDPHKAKSAEDPSVVQTVYDELVDLRRELAAEDGAVDSTKWAAAVNKYVGSLQLDADFAASMQHALSLSTDEDLIWATLKSLFVDEAGDGAENHGEIDVEIEPEGDVSGDRPEESLE